MKTLLFDTDVLIDILRGNQKTIQAVYKLMEEYNHAACSCIAVGEILAGMRPNEERLTRKLLDGLEKFPVTETIAELAGTLKQRTKTHQLCFDDCLIAATAMSHDSLLLTKNIKHYPFRQLIIKKIPA